MTNPRTGLEDIMDEAVPWTEIGGMRDKLIHRYATVDLQIIWTTIEHDIPEIIRVVRSIMADLDEYL